MSLIRPGESIWEFELRGSGRSAAYPEGFNRTSFACMPYGRHAVVRGKWLRPEVKRLRILDPSWDLSQRPIMSVGEHVRWRFRWLGAELLGRWPKLRNAGPVRAARERRNLG